MSSVISRFHEAAEENSVCPALMSDAATMSYGELSSRAKTLAAAIDGWFRLHLGRPVQIGDTVGVSGSKSVDLYVCILGILTSGASYMPVDPDLPAQTQSYMVDVCTCHLVIVDETQPEDSTRIRLSTLTAATLNDGRFLGIAPTETDLCYTIFTSGTTGQPKGVQVPHLSVLNLVEWYIREFSITVGSRALQYSTINFDASILDIFPTLLSGACLLIPTQSQRLSASELAEFCERHQVSHAFLPPSLLGVLAADRFRSIQVLLTGGEACSPAVLEAWLPGRRVFNLYGPTEGTVLVSFKRVEPGMDSRNIGQPIPGVRLHVLDEQMGAARRGELFISGMAVAAGYVAGTAPGNSRFVQHPRTAPGAMYRTGDIVEYDESGDLLFIARADRQVKVRGYRIELDEIESSLMAAGCVAAAVTINSAGRLVAYVVLPQGGISMDQLKDALSQRLPEYKLPQYVLSLGGLPVKVNGKVDYGALPDPVLASPLVELRQPTTLLQAEQDLVTLWSQTLAVPPESLFEGSNFRDLGGTSLDIVSLLAQLESKFGIQVSFMDFFLDPTIRFLSEALKYHEPNNSSDTEPCGTDGAQH